MSKKDFERIQKVGNIKKAFEDFEELVGLTPRIFLPDTQFDIWRDLEREYDEFYAMDLQDRLYFSELATPPENDETKK